MDRERRFYIAYEVCIFLNNREPSNRRFKRYEIAMYTAELAECIQIAEEEQDGEILKQYYNVLNEELQEHILYYGKEHEWTIKVETLIGLLDEWKN